MGTIFGDAQLGMWDGGCLLIGSVAKFPVHAHPAIHSSAQHNHHGTSKCSKTQLEPMPRTISICCG
ncbi:MAG: hypothetical protein M3Y64_05740, partial [Gemmatimonadota bacterium]|nr:hypothetical protein [Gemmatimonadota bacterium]